MSAAPIAPLYEAVLVPVLQRIQHEFGYLKQEEIERYSQESGVPQYRLWAVASFFPHFRLTPPKKITVKVCRDMACHLSGSAEMLREFKASVGENVAIEGTSCVGRCDRCPAASVSVAGIEHDYYYLGKTVEEMRKIIDQCLAGVPPAP